MKAKSNYQYSLYSLKIDPEFERLHIPMDPKKLKRLELNITYRGVTKPITVWNGIIVDGHKRYRIYHSKNIPFPICDIEFSNRYDVMEWICDKNLLRFDLTDEYKKYFIGKKLQIRIEKSNSYMTSYHYSYGFLGKTNSKQSIARQIGDELSLSHGTILKYEQYMCAIDKITSREPDISEKILSGQIRVAHDNVLMIAGLSDEDLRILRGSFNSYKQGKILSSQIWHELQWNRIHPKNPEKHKESTQTAEIKKMPKFDPDAELQSLSLTIPMWRSSIERVKTVADFEIATQKAKRTLLRQLEELSDAIDRLSLLIKEDDIDHGNRTIS